VFFFAYFLSYRELLSLGLSVTCIYTGLEESKSFQPYIQQGRPPSSPSPLNPQIVTPLPSNQDERSIAYMENMERVKLLFAKIRKRGSPSEVEALIKILPQLLLDLFHPEVALSFIMGEFIRQIDGAGYPEMIAVVIQKIFTICKEIKQHHLVIHWVLLCLKNFMQLRSKDSSIWALTCLLLAASDDSLSRAFFQEIAKEICIDEDIFIYSVSQFYNYQESRPSSLCYDRPFHLFAFLIGFK